MHTFQHNRSNNYTLYNFHSSDTGLKVSVQWDSASVISRLHDGLCLRTTISFNLLSQMQREQTVCMELQGLTGPPVSRWCTSEYGATVQWRWWWEQPIPVLLCPPQIPYGMPKVWSWQITARAMARSKVVTLPHVPWWTQFSVT